MKRKMNVMIAALLLLVSVVLPISKARASMMNVTGDCSFSNSGRNVTFGGETDSGKVEDEIGVTAILWEKQGNTWVEVSRVSKTRYDSDYVDTDKSYSITGGHYYKVTATHYTCTNGVTSTGSSHTGSFWIS